MAETKNLCAQIPIALHTQVCEAREQSGLTTAEYITNLLIEYFEMKGNGGKTIMANNTRTMAFQIPEDLFQRIKAHLERETADKAVCGPESIMAEKLSQLMSTSPIAAAHITIDVDGGSIEVKMNPLWRKLREGRETSPPVRQHSGRKQSPKPKTQPDR